MRSVKVKEKTGVAETMGKQQGSPKSQRPFGAEWTAAALSTVIKLNNIIGFLPINIDKTLKAVVDETYNLFNPQMCCIYVVGEGNNLELAAFRTSDGLIPDFHVNSTTEACSTLRDGLPYLACRGTSCSASICPNRKTPDNADISHACIPMITGNDIHGVLSLTYQPERVLPRDKLNVLLSIANQVSMAIQRYNLFEKLRKEKSEIERTYSEIATLNEMLTKKIEELKDTQNRLIQSEKLAATGELTAGLCHEINNPISIILNRIECLEMEAKELLLPESVLKDLDVISSYAAKVSSIVQDLLIFSRHHPVEFGHINIKAIIETVAGMLHDDLDRNGCIAHMDIPHSVPDIYGDADRLEQVFRNLIANAIDAMPDGGNIYIDARIPSERPDFLLVRIKDEGEGIAEENLHRIFDPFFTTKKLGKGSGLGLSICYGIIKNHGGDITVKSVLNSGTIFSVYLPLRQGMGAGCE
ncbi:MAG: ATP-binding protein [Nitrospirota bacterium]